MSTKKQLATITILVKDRQTHAADVNRLLTEAGNLIIARLGINTERSGIKHCTGMITIALEGTTKQIKGLARKLDKLYGIVAKANIMTNEK